MTRTSRGYKLNPSVTRLAYNAVAALQNVKVYSGWRQTTLADFLEEAIRREHDRLAALHNGGEPFRRSRRKTRTGRPRKLVR